ncbi:MAG: FAD-dependent oxidoreductase, partial [Dehalococcoidia bacterium]|nr:FAD-dependent oxidoreductase [Dehalococcoidia bacterium]
MGKPKIIIVGGGFAGCAASVAAAKAGAEVLLLERTDMLIAGGIRAGRMNFNGKLVAAEEAKALGGGEIFESLESIILHRGNIVDELHGYIYNTAIAEPVVRRAVEKAGVKLNTCVRITGVKKDSRRIVAVIAEDGSRYSGDAFIDATGTFGGVAVCKKWGKGCVMCAGFRCMTFGDRVSVATKAGAEEFMRYRPDGTPGVMGAAITIHKSSLNSTLKNKLEQEGAVSVPLPAGLIDYSKQQKIGGIRSRKQMEFINIVDIGVSAKCVGIGYLTLDDLRTVPGLEEAIIEDPLGGGLYNNINKVSMSPRDDGLLAKGFENLFLAGEKAGPGTGIAEVLVTGALSGYNSVRKALGMDPLVLPSGTAIGDFIAFTGEMMELPGGLKEGYSFAHGTYFERMKSMNLY